MTTICKSEISKTLNELNDVAQAIVSGESVWRKCPNEPIKEPWVKVECIDTGYPRSEYFIGEDPYKN